MGKIHQDKIINLLKKECLKLFCNFYAKFVYILSNSTKIKILFVFEGFYYNFSFINKFFYETFLKSFYLFL